MTGSKYSGSQCRCTARWSTSSATPSSAAFIRSMVARISASLPPPAWQIATQVLQPNTSTFLKPLTISQISGNGFCVPTIIGLSRSSTLLPDLRRVDRRRPEGPHLLDELRADLRPARPHRRGEVEHLQA